MSSPESRNSPTFFRDELKRALDEQSFGIVSYALRDEATAFEATARVTLLEGADVDIVLSIRGYQAAPVSGSTIAVDSTSHFETIEALLQQLSRLYAEKRAEVLYAKLMA